MTRLTQNTSLSPASPECSLASFTFPNNAKWNYLSCVWHRGLACDVIWCVFVQSLPGKTVEVHLSRGNGDRSTKVCFHGAELWGKWGARGPRDDCRLSVFFPPTLQTCFYKHQECVKMHSPSTFLSFLLQASIHHPPIRGAAQSGHAFFLSVKWKHCSVRYCIHHCSRRELWERSTLTEDVKSWDGFQALLIFPSVSLSLARWCFCDEARLNNCTASNSTHDASGEIYMSGAFGLHICLEWRCMSPTMKTHWVNTLSLRAQRARLMKTVKNTSKSYFISKST